MKKLAFLGMGILLLLLLDVVGNYYRFFDFGMTQESYGAELGALVPVQPYSEIEKFLLETGTKIQKKIVIPEGRYATKTQLWIIIAGAYILTNMFFIGLGIITGRPWLTLGLMVALSGFTAYGELRDEGYIREVANFGLLVYGAAEVLSNYIPIMKGYLNPSAGFKKKVSIGLIFEPLGEVLKVGLDVAYGRGIDLLGSNFAFRPPSLVENVVVIFVVTAMSVPFLAGGSHMMQKFVDYCKRRK